MAVTRRNGLAFLPVMVVSLFSNARWALVACAWLLLAPPRASAEAPAPQAPASAAPAAAQPPAPEPGGAAPSQASPGGALPDPFAAQAAPPEEDPESLGWALVRTVVLLLAVLASIYLTLNVGLRRLMGLQGIAAGRQPLVSVVERVPLDQRRSLLVLKAADEYLLVGSAEGGLQLLSKLDTQAVDRIRAERPPAQNVPLSPFLQKLLSRRTGSTPPRS